MELDIKKIKFLVSEIKESIEEIRKIAKIPEKEFWADKRNILAIEHLLLRAIEATSNICVHIAARKLKKGVESPAECFELLGKEKLIPKKLSDRLRKMARFRNVLVHRYWEIDEKRVYQYAKENLGDFEEFIEAISQEFNFK
jgi:uncharacterized protein YutE (UPF0331/DUF86 family)